MYEFETEKGNILFYDINYSLGGYSYATNSEMKRGYYLSVQRKRNEFMAYQGLEHESGAIRQFVHEVKRKSNTQELIAYDKAMTIVKEIVEKYDL